MSDNFIIEASEGLLPPKGDAPATSENKEVKSTESLDSSESAAAEDNEKKASDLAGQSETESTDDESQDEIESKEDEADVSEEDQELESAKKKKGGWKRKTEKIAKLTRENQELKDTIYRLQQSGGEQTPQKESKAAVDSSKPNPNDFETNAEYIEAYVKWELEQDRKKTKEENAKAEGEKQLKSSLDSYNSKVSEFKKEAKDFDVVVKNFVEEFDGSISPTIHGIILKHEQGPKLFYELAKDPEEFERINSLDDYSQAYELGKLEAKISQSKLKTTETKKLTTAPSPAKPVQSKSTVVKKDIYSPDLSYAEYEKMMNERMKNYRRY